MSLTAFTNDVGNHLKTVVRSTQEFGQFFGRPPYTKETLYTCNQALSRKPPPHPGDRKKAYDYNREIAEVTIDEPYSVRHFDYHLGDDGERYYNWDYTSEHLLSQEHIPFSFRPEGAEYEDDSSDRANVRALNSLVDNKSQLGADIGEIRQTFGLFSKSAISLASALLAARRGNWKLIPKLLGMRKSDILKGKHPAQRWLEYQYGWRPLMGSIYDTANALQYALSKGAVIKGVGNSKWNHDVEFRYGSNKYQVSMKGTHRRVYLAMVQVDTIVTLNSLGLINPASIAWELVPFSFAIDWFMPVGQVLEAMTAPWGLQPLGGYESMRREYVMDIYRDMPDDDPYHRQEVSKGHLREVGFAFQRTAFAEFQLPQLFTNPSPYSTTRALNALALVRQLHKG